MTLNHSRCYASDPSNPRISSKVHGCVIPPPVDYPGGDTATVPGDWSAAEWDREWDRNGAESGVSRLLSTMDLAYPFEGRWLTQNSPANRVPSHGTALFATTFAIDFVPVNEAGRTAPITLGSLLRPEPAERFPGFGRPILAPVRGVVVGEHPHGA